MTSATTPPPGPVREPRAAAAAARQRGDDRQPESRPAPARAARAAVEALEGAAALLVAQRAALVRDPQRGRASPSAPQSISTVEPRGEYLIAFSTRLSRITARSRLAGAHPQLAAPVASTPWPCSAAGSSQRRPRPTRRRGARRAGARGLLAGGEREQVADERPRRSVSRSAASISRPSAGLRRPSRRRPRAAAACPSGECGAGGRRRRRRRAGTRARPRAGRPSR